MTNKYCLLRLSGIAYCVVRIIGSRTTQYARYALSGIALSIAFIITSVCGGNAHTEPVPPQIHYGEDMCEFCGMIVSDERYAAGYITQNGQEHIFDDIGDMLQSRLQESEDIKAIFVHDHDEHAWLKAESASYASSKNLPTPMLSGLAAFASPERAKDFAAELDGQVFSFDELLTYYRENPPTPAGNGG